MMQRSRQIQARQATKIETEDNKSVRSAFSNVEIRKRQTNRGIENQACEIEREKEKGPAAARILGTTAARIKISDAIAHTRTYPWNKILKCYVIISRKQIATTTL